MKRLMILMALICISVSTGTSFADAGKKLPEGCAHGQVAKWQEVDLFGAPTGVWVCADDQIAAPEMICLENAFRYCILGDGTVKDMATGLIWLQNTKCLDLGTRPDGTANWYEATDAVAELEDGECGLTDGSTAGDWRLPTKEEWDAKTAQAHFFGCTDWGTGHPPSLMNITGTGCYHDGPQAFSGVRVYDRPYYWSSTTRETNPDVAGYMPLLSGLTWWVYKGDYAYVWPVRDP